MWFLIAEKSRQTGGRNKEDEAWAWGEIIDYLSIVDYNSLLLVIN